MSEKKTTWIKTNAYWISIAISIIGVIGVIVTSCLNFSNTIGKIEERTENLKDDIAEIKNNIESINTHNTDVDIRLTKFESSVSSDTNALSQRLLLIENKIGIKLQEGMGGGTNLKLGIKDRSYTGHVGYISMKKGDPTFSGELYDPNASVAALNMCSPMSKTKIGQIVIVVRTEFANDVVENLYAGPLVSVVINDIFYDYQNPDRLLLLSESALNKLG